MKTDAFFTESSESTPQLPVLRMADREIFCGNFGEFADQLDDFLAVHRGAPVALDFRGVGDGRELNINIHLMDVMIQHRIKVAVIGKNAFHLGADGMRLAQKAVIFAKTVDEAKETLFAEQGQPTPVASGGIIDKSIKQAAHKL